MERFTLSSPELLVTRQPVLRLLAACLAFVPAMLFGVVAVNKYYGYYQTWHAALADLTNQGGATGNTAPHRKRHHHRARRPALAAQRATAPRTS
jgi:hypothetical protein